MQAGAKAKVTVAVTAAAKLPPLHLPPPHLPPRLQMRPQTQVGESKSTAPLHLLLSRK